MDSPELARELEHVELLLRTSEGILKKVATSANPVQHYILIIEQLRHSIIEEIDRLRT